MAFTVDDHFISEWSGVIQILQQQRMSRLRPAVRIETASGETHYVEQLASTTVQETSTRHTPSSIVEMDHRLRAIHPRFFKWETIIDDEDKVRLLTDPTSVYNENAASGFERIVDKVIIDAANATAYTGKGGTTATAFDTNYAIASSGVGLNQTKLISAMQKLKAAETEGPYYCAIKAKQNSDLLAIPQVTSVDFNQDKPLVEGMVPYYMGFNMIHTEQLNVVSSEDIVICWARNSIGLGIWKEREMNLAKDPQYQYNYHPHIKQFIGATRLDEVGVVTIACA